jgi:hypothetical protein
MGGEKRNINKKADLSCFQFSLMTDQIWGRPRGCMPSLPVLPHFMASLAAPAAVLVRIPLTASGSKPNSTWRKPKDNIVADKL